MNFFKTSLLATLPFLALVACSDSGSPTSNLDQGATDVESPGDENGNPVPGNQEEPFHGSHNWQNNYVPGPQVSANSASPITSAGYVPSGSIAIQVKGSAEGPLASNSKVSVYGFDSENVARSADFASTFVSGSAGVFSASGSITSNYALIEASGSYYDFFGDEYVGNLSLGALVDMQGKTTANVNILTTIAMSRTTALLRETEMSFKDAKAQAEKDVRNAFHIENDETPFEDISMLGDTQASANLFMITTMLVNAYSGTELSTVISSIANDIATDGKWDDAKAKASLADKLVSMGKDLAIRMLIKKAGLSSLPCSKLLRLDFWWYEYGLGDCTEKNEGSVLKNNNSNSSSYNATYMCKDSTWSQVSEAIVLSGEVSKTFGECNSSNEGTVKTYTDGTDFICKKNYWVKASGTELDNAKVTAAKGACSSTNSGTSVQLDGAYYLCLGTSWRKLAKAPIDYSKGRAMNKKLGKGINFGNSWDAEGVGDGGWNNPIQDGDFTTVKNAGFNSVRIPVRWAAGVDAQLNGVKADVQLAINAGLTVIVNSHHHDNLYSAAQNGSFSSALQNFSNEWKKVAQAFDSFADDKVVFEIFNEPHDMTQDQVNQIMTTGYQAIRSVSKGKTIMFEGNGYAKFAQIQNLNLPDDGNIIVSGHYYDPYTFTHQGHKIEQYPCANMSAPAATTVSGHFKAYRDSITAHFPDINGGSVPVNVGEFGVANKGACRSVTDANRAAWTKAVVEAAENNGMSWHYWCFKNCGGFEASNGSSWYSGMLNAFKLSN